MEENFLVYILAFVSYFIFTICRLRYGRNRSWFCCRSRERNNNDTIPPFDNFAGIPLNQSPSHGMNPDRRREYILEKIVVKKVEQMTEVEKSKNQKELEKAMNSTKKSDQEEETKSEGKTQEDEEENEIDMSDMQEIDISGDGNDDYQSHDVDNDEEKGSDSDSNSTSDSDEENQHSGSDASQSPNNKSQDNQSTVSNNSNEKEGYLPLKSLFDSLKNSIRSLDPKNDHNEDEENDGEDPDMCKVCPICLSEFEEGQEICESTNEECHHSFHLECMIEWLMKHDECPLCRLNYLNDSNPVGTDTVNDEERGGEMTATTNNGLSFPRRDVIQYRPRRLF